MASSPVARVAFAMIVTLASVQQATFHTRSRVSIPEPSAVVKPPDTTAQREFIRRLDLFSASFERLRENLAENVSIKKIVSLSEASVTSNSPLDLSVDSTPTRLNSTEAINASLENSYTPTDPQFSGGSTSEPTLTGNYDGSLGADTLTFTVTEEGNVGGQPFTGTLGLGLFPADLEIEVRTSDNTLVDTIAFSEADPEDTPYAIGATGISVALSLGSIELGDTFDVVLQQADLESANVNGSMRQESDGSTNANFEQGLFVVDGSFDINGVTISVDENSSIDDVLTLITNSAAGVTVTYNATTDQLELVQKTSGSSGQILLENDTSGFFAATKIDGAVAVPGTDSDLDLTMSEVAGLGAITSGSLTVNGVSVSFDTTVDSLRDVITRLNESEAEVAASYANGYFTIRSQRFDLGLSIQDNGTDFFDTLLVDEGVVEGLNQNAIKGLRKGVEILDERFVKLSDRLTGLLAAESDPATSVDAKALREGLKQSVLTALDNVLNIKASDVETDGVIDTGLGLVFDFSESAESVIEIDEKALMDSLRENPKRLMNFLFQEESGQKDSGFLELVSETLDTSKRKFANALGVNSGLFLDVFA